LLQAVVNNSNFAVLKHLFHTCLVLLMLASCTHRITKRHGRELLQETNAVIAVRTDTTEHINILYTGCGGMAIVAGNEAVLVDPYSTPHGILKARFGHVQPDPANTHTVLTWLNALTSTLNIRAVLVTHSHIDHMEDLPLLLRNDLLPRDVKIVGSPTARCILRGQLHRATFYNADSVRHDPRHDRGDSTRWLTLTPNIRVLPIESMHSPHIFGYLAMGCPKNNVHCCPDMDGIDSPDQRTRGNDWKVGRVYSYLVDIARNGKTIRLFVQTSASSPPFGLPPQAELEKRPVDLAAYCMALFHNVKRYPGRVDSVVHATRSLIIHWENFGKPFLYETPRSVTATSPHRFMKALQRSRGVNTVAALKPYFMMPRPGVVLRVCY
jgi:glyoxylase-like metal-dependent hydrolase (beta-lactamase superfamily II)